ncbi:MAG: hypothetical protein SF028_08225 [Candidatus Sumerlaeia bacterium]|nr:hypothetical protein [Candidatus Sumerlaeia bacterium]
MNNAYERPEFDLSLREVPGGVQVTQHGRTYLARRWRLTPQVLGVVESALSHGLTALWQQGHPGGDDSHHISFAFDHRPASWVFVIGGEARPPALRCVTFNKRLKEYFKVNGLGYLWQWETDGGKNILVRPEDLAPVLSVLPLDDIREGRLPVVDRKPTRPGSDQYYRHEKDLESELHRRLAGSPQPPFDIQRQRSFPSNDSFDPISRPDVLVVEADAVLIVELKLHSGGEVEFSQLLRYMNNRALQQEFAPRATHGVLVADRFDQAARDAASHHPDTSLAEYLQHPDGRLEIRTVVGKDHLTVYLKA